MSSEATKLHTENESLREQIAKLKDIEQDINTQEIEIDTFLTHLSTLEVSVTNLTVKINKKCKSQNIRKRWEIRNLFNKKN